MTRRLLIRMTTLLATLAILSGCTSGAGTAPEVDDAAQAPEVFTFEIKEIKKHGNVVLDASFDDIRTDGMDVGDMIGIVVGDAEYDVPIGTSFTDVDSGEMVCRFDDEDNEVSLAINMGSFAEETGIGEKQTIEEDPGYQWDVKVPEVGLYLKEKEGYLDEYHARNLARSDAREDYPNLSDDEFANFRLVSVSGVKDGVLYRSSSPLDPDLSRNTYAMTAMEAAGVRSVINLTDSEEQMKAYDTYQGSYYSTCDVINPEMNYDFGSEEFSADVKQGVLFIAEHDGPYLIHCKEGKDRTGMLCAVLECFAGASYDEVCDDYMQTYRNFYNVMPDDTSYPIILKNNLVKTLSGLFQIDDLESADLKDEATEYLLSIGVTEEDLAVLEAVIAE